MPDALGDRMKAYENISRIYLTKRLPVIIRIDGRAFHSFTRGFGRPFDELLHKCMWETTKALCEQVGGVKLAYAQSDEISLLLTNDDTLTTEPWFGNSLQKLVSISASIATLEFNKVFLREYMEREEILDHALGDIDEQGNPRDLSTFIHLLEAYERSNMKAQFDARAFVLPPSEVANYFIWRQQDATRNSVQIVAQSLFSHKQLMNKNTDQLQEMIYQAGRNWNDYPVCYKRGVCCLKKPSQTETCVTLGDGTTVKMYRNQWTIDKEIPVFTQDRGYIENTFLER